MKRVTEADGDWREQFVRALHDDVQQLLFSSRLSLDRVAAQPGRVSPQRARLLAEARARLDEAIAATRTLAQGLWRPPGWAGGLQPGLQRLADEAHARYGVRVTLNGDPPLATADPDVERLVLRAVRELLFNVARHAGTAHAHVGVHATSRDLTVVVADQGRGFAPGATDRAASRGTGLGLASLRQRLTVVGGRLVVHSAPGRGTRVAIVVPRRPPASDGRTSGRPQR